MVESGQYKFAPELETEAWINTPNPLCLAELKGKVVVIHAFQMLCPGCVSQGIPQAKAIHEIYAHEDVQVIGLHTVFEHHEVMNIDVLKAFVGENKIPFPIGIDSPASARAIPLTMDRYQMQGTPTLILIDKHRQIRLSHFGQIHDMQVAKFISSMLAENYEPSLTKSS